MGKNVIFNGELLPKSKASLPLDNRGTLYGDGLFETMRCKGVIPPFYNLHWQRLTEGIAFLKMQYEKAFSKNSLLQQINRLIISEKFYSGCSVRINCIRKAGGKYTPTHQGIDYFIEAFELKDEEYTLNPEGLNIGLFKDLQKATGTYGNFKNSNATLSVLGGLASKENNWDECLLFNTSGYLTESTSSNLFIKIGNDIATPSLSTGCVNGTIRKVLMEIIPSTGVKIHELDNLNEEVLLNAEEVFLTNAVSGIRWVGGYQRKRYFFQYARELMTLLNQAFNENHLKLSQQMKG